MISNSIPSCPFGIVPVGYSFSWLIGSLSPGFLAVELTAIPIENEHLLVPVSATGLVYRAVYPKGEGNNMSISSNLITRINRLESWIENRPRPLLLCPLRLLCTLLLFVGLMLSNLLAVARWPLSALVRVFRSNRNTSPGEPIPVNEQQLMELARQDLPVVVDFWAEWCGPCLLMNGVLHEFAKAEASCVIVAKVDATLHPRLTSKHKVSGLPTILLCHAGQEIGRHVGPMSPEQLRRFVEEGMRKDEEELPL